MPISIGDFVRVPVASRKLIGIIWQSPNSDPNPDNLSPDKIREILEKFEGAPLPHEVCQFIDWVSHYTLAPKGMVLRMVLSVPKALEPSIPKIGIRFCGTSPSNLTKSRQKVMAFAAANKIWQLTDLSRKASVSPSVLKGLLSEGILEQVQMVPSLLPPTPPQKLPPPPSFTKEQKTSVQELRQRICENNFSTTLLDGITGSGKTEVYFEAIASCLEQGRQVLILLPEIALTSTFLERFESRFGYSPIAWHSATTPSRREKIWRSVRQGQLPVIAGARSALFLPFQDLGLIIVDEEHDAAYKQEDRVFYHARDMAVVRSMLGNFPCILASATPSLESRVNAKDGRYHHLRLLHRFKGAVLPQISSIDLRQHPPPRGEFISPPLREAITKTIEQGKQALLFLNRRGYAPLTLCRTCGHRLNCSQCSAWLVEHRHRNQLQCHHCGYTQSVPQSCPSCKKTDTLIACGPGVERIGQEVANLFPDARAIVLSSDITGGLGTLKDQLTAIEKGEIDIIIGTQLIAKGHDFPNINCVGVIDADLSTGADPRASERTFQLLSQVTGRAGRTSGESYGYLQTYAPDHPVLLSLISGEFEAFYDREIQHRQTAQLPPFCRLVALLVSGRDLKATSDYARALKLCATNTPNIRILGPAPRPSFTSSRSPSPASPPTCAPPI